MGCLKQDRNPLGTLNRVSKCNTILYGSHKIAIKSSVMSENVVSLKPYSHATIKIETYNSSE